MRLAYVVLIFKVPLSLLWLSNLFQVSKQLPYNHICHFHEVIYRLAFFLVELACSIWNFLVSTKMTMNDGDTLDQADTHTVCIWGSLNKSKGIGP